MNTNKIDLIRELEFHDNFEKLGDTLIKWSKKSNNSEIKVCKKCLSEIGMYVSLLEMNIKTSEIAIKDYQSRSIIYRNQLNDFKNRYNELKKQNDKMKQELIDNFKKDISN